MQRLPAAPMKFTARNDYAFKKLFGTEENKDIMIEFISLVTDLSQDDFDDVRIGNNEQLPRFYNDKTGRLDIKIRLNDGRKIDVEMSFSDRHPVYQKTRVLPFGKTSLLLETTAVHGGIDMESLYR